MAYHSFEDLDVWQKACRLSVKIYQLLSDCTDYGMKSQMTRAAVSIASNIAEGSERDSKLDFIRFLNIAKSSAAELRTQVYIATRIQIIPEKVERELINELKSISRMIYYLIKSIRA